MELDSQHLARMSDPEDLRKFLFGGKAYIMLACRRKTVTYLVERSKNAGASQVEFFVNVVDLKGFNQYLGHIFKGEHNYVHGQKSRFNPASNQAIMWELFYNVFNFTNRIHNEIEVWHHGYCGKCGQPVHFGADVRTGVHATCP